MDTVTLMSLVATLIASLLAAKYSTNESRTMQIGKLSEFLDSIAECLIEMKTELAHDRIPTLAGNKLRQVLKNYEQAIKKAPMDKQLKAALIETKTEIESCLVQGRVEDDILRGLILRTPENKKEAALLDMERTAAKLQGIAEILPSIS